MKVMEGSISFIPEIPDDIIFDVLSRLPFKTLVRFSCVCKFWRKLIISDHSFIQSHLRDTLKNTTGYKNLLLNACIGDNPRGFTCKEDPNSESVKLIEKVLIALEKSSGSRLFFRGDRFKLAACCDGVICFVQFNNCMYPDLESRIYLCNPALRQWRALPPSHYRDRLYASNTVVSFFFDPMFDDYKVVKIMHRHISFSVEIYSLRSNSWKRLSLKISPCVERDFQLVESSVVHNEFSFWLTRNPLCLDRFLYVLDVSQENIREISFPGRFIFAELLIFQGSLSVFGCNYDRQNELWVMIDDGKGSISWMKQLIFPDIPRLRLLPNRTTGITASGEYFVSSLEGKVHPYNPENHKLDKHINIELNFLWRLDYVVADYVASLVSVIPPPVDKQFCPNKILKVFCMRQFLNGKENKIRNREERRILNEEASKGKNNATRSHNSTRSRLLTRKFSCFGFK